ncbi:MAG: hypothetical protein ABL929_04210 [Ferruginibacter sp.]
MIAYNLMALFRTFVLQDKTQKTLSTIRYRTFAIGAYFEKINDKLVLKITLSKKEELGLADFGTTANSLSIHLKWLMRNLGLIDICC